MPASADHRAISCESSNFISCKLYCNWLTGLKPLVNAILRNRKPVGHINACNNQPYLITFIHIYGRWGELELLCSYLEFLETIILCRLRSIPYGDLRHIR